MFIYRRADKKQMSNADGREVLLLQFMTKCKFFFSLYRPTPVTNYLNTIQVCFMSNSDGREVLLLQFMAKCKFFLVYIRQSRIT